MKLDYELELKNKGYEYICGCDEAGRGPLAGPVAVAACIMPLDNLIEGIDDSKKISQKKREELYVKIINTALAYNVVFIDENEIDRVNILNATKEGMEKAINGLSIKPDYVLVDAVKGLNLNCEYLPIIKGDALSYSIGAASILAKVTRDRLMLEMDKEYPEYNLKKHKGYGTKEHIENIKKYGPSPIHRLSFIKKIYNK